MKRLLCIFLALSLLLSGCAAFGDLTALSGDTLVTAISLKYLGSDPKALSPEERTVYIAASLELEIMNGGLCQFFANAPDCVPHVPEALDALGATEHKALYQQFLADTGIDPLDPMFQTEDIEEFSRLYDLYPWDDFDNTYLTLTPIPELLEAYIRSHPDAF